MRLITILGASGFVGSHLVAALSARNIDHLAIKRHDEIPRRNLGDVLYCIGLTADFRAKPFETVEAHVCSLSEILQKHVFDSLTYLSSARVYANDTSATETDVLSVNPARADDLYNISKLMGESLTLNCGKQTRVVRLSNIYGDDPDSENFLPAIIRDALTTGKVMLQSAAESAKDYISIDDVVKLLIEICTHGTERLYNVASGKNVTNAELAAGLRAETGCTIEFAPNAPCVTFPLINTERIRSEFGFSPRLLLDELHNLIASERNSISKREKR